MLRYSPRKIPASLLFLIGAFAAWIAAPRLVVAEPAASPTTGWSAAGTLLEACTCAVPCTCNFGEGPSPHDYCHAVFGYRVDKGAWGGIDVSGLVFGGADGPKGGMGFVDARATPSQREVLQKMARAVFAKGGPARGPRDFLPVAITHTVQGRDLRLNFGDWGGFTGRVIMGRDGKSPIVVENNTVWPIARAIKAKALPLKYKDERGNVIDGDGTNANYGSFSFSGDIGPTARVTAPAKKAVAASCCAGKR